VEREVAGKNTANAHNNVAAIFIGREDSKIASSSAAVSRDSVWSIWFFARSRET